jgi:hypothetical protein
MDLTHGADDASSRCWLVEEAGGGMGAHDIRARQRGTSPNVSRGAAVRAYGLG